MLPPAPPPPIHCVALGASDVVGVGARHPETEGWAPRLEKALPAHSRLTRLGLSGGVTGEIRRQLLARAIAARPDVVVVSVGTNDIVQLVGPEQFKAELDGLLRPLATTGAKLFLLDLPDLDLFPVFRGYGAHVRMVLPLYRTIIHRAASHYSVRLIDTRPLSARLPHQPQLLSADGFHPSSAGYTLLADQIARGIRGASGPARPASVIPLPPGPTASP